MVEKINIKKIAEEIRNARNLINESNGVLENLVFEKHDYGASIEANQSGLLELAYQIILLAEANGSEKYIDIDKASFASKSDGVLTISINKDL